MRPIGGLKSSDSDSECVILDSDNYENYGVGICPIEIAHEGERRRNGAFTEERSISRSELGKWMRIAPIGRPGAIYDASAAAQTFPGAERSILWGGVGVLPRK